MFSSDRESARFSHDIVFGLRVATACICAVFGTITSAAAQVTPQVAPLVTNGAHCSIYDVYPPSAKTKGFAPDITEFKECLDELHRAVTATSAGSDGVPDNAPAPPGPAPAAAAEGTANPTAAEQLIHTNLLREYLAYRRLKRWQVWFVDYVKSAPSTTAPAAVALPPSCANQQIFKNARCLSATVSISDLANVTDSYNGLAVALNDGLVAHAIGQPFSAQLVTAFTIQSAGGQGASSGSPSAGSTSASGVQKAASSPALSGAGLVEWQSIHFFADPFRRFDVSFSGRFGFDQTAAPVQTTSSDGVATVLTVFEPAFVWKTGLENNWRMADTAELSIFGDIGQTVLSGTSTLIQNGTNATVAVSADNNSGQAELFGEFGAGLNLYGQSMDLLHLNKGLLTPRLAFSGGLGRDERFAKQGILASFDSPESRLFFRVSVDALQVVDHSQGDKPFTVGISIDYERALHRSGQHIPTGTRLLLTGSLNLFKATQTGK